RGGAGGLVDVVPADRLAVQTPDLARALARSAVAGRVHARLELRLLLVAALSSADLVRGDLRPAGERGHCDGAAHPLVADPRGATGGALVLVRRRAPCGGARVAPRRAERARLAGAAALASLTARRVDDHLAAARRGHRGEREDCDEGRRD